MEQEKKVKKAKLTAEEHQALLAKATEFEQVKKDLEETQRQLAEMKDKFLRSHADFDNAKKRLAKEKQEFLRFANERLVRGLLPILDNFERAISHANPSEEGNSNTLKEGITLIEKQLADFLARHGLVRLETLGKKFDPHFHESIGHVESHEHADDETILEEVEAGYLFEGRLLRPAKVRISHRPHPKPILENQHPSELP